ncbi:MAG: hypothetical protein Tsb009_26870 [Planctomycetaceae bacterium]
MVKRFSENRFVWLAVGLIAGLGVSYFWPHEPALATGNDRDAKFGMLTTPMAPNVEGVFVLDYLTGQMTGAVLNSATGKFNHVYLRNVAVDFNVDPKAQPHYAFVAGQAALPRRVGVVPGASVIYVGELSSGKVLAYGMNYPRTTRAVPPQKFILFGAFPFREAVGRE